MANIIFIAPQFQNLDNEILKVLEKKYNVVFIRDRLSNNSLYKSIIRLKPNLFSYIYKIYLDHRLKKYDKFDYLFVINGEDLTNQIVNHIKLKYKIKKSYFYVWDSLKQKKNAINIYKEFDFSFSYQNEKIPKIKHLELFHLSQKQTISEKYKFFFTGTVYSNREKIISEIIKNYQKEKNFIYYFFQARWYYWIKKIFGKTKLDYKKVHFKSLNNHLFIKTLNQSEIIIEINHFNNNGISQRGIESLYLNKKIITNNRKILNYSKNVFYFKNKIDQSKLKKFIDKEKYDAQYTGKNIDEWINTIFKS